MTNEAERLQILEMIEKGVISAEEGVRLLNSLQGEAEPTALPPIAPTSSAGGANAAAPEVIIGEPVPEDKPARSSSDFAAETRKWRGWWWIPLTVGIVITALSGFLMVLAYQSGGFGFWFACLWFPLLLGVLVISLAAASRTARWLHVRVHQEPGEWPRTIAISMPIPIRFTAWLMRVLKPFIHIEENINLDEIILALEKLSPEQPLYVHVDEGESGERVEVFIG